MKRADRAAYSSATVPTPNPTLAIPFTAETVKSCDDLNARSLGPPLCSSACEPLQYAIAAGIAHRAGANIAVVIPGKYTWCDRGRKEL